MYLFVQQINYDVRGKCVVLFNECSYINKDNDQVQGIIELMQVERRKAVQFSERKSNSGQNHLHLLPLTQDNYSSDVTILTYFFML